MRFQAQLYQAVRMLSLEISFLHLLGSSFPCTGSNLRQGFPRSGKMPSAGLSPHLTFSSLQTLKRESTSISQELQQNFLNPNPNTEVKSLTVRPGKSQALPRERWSEAALLKQCDYWGCLPKGNLGYNYHRKE